MTDYEIKDLLERINRHPLSQQREALLHILAAFGGACRVVELLGEEYLALHRCGADP